MDLFASTGFRPFRTMTRAMCSISNSGCSAVILTSRSFMDLTRLQSVLEAFKEEEFFMSSRSSKRDHVNAFVDFKWLVERTIYHGRVRIAGIALPAIAGT